MIDAALNGFGIAYLPEDIVRSHIAARDLICILDDSSPFFSGYYIDYPSRRQNLPAFKVLVDALRWRADEGERQDHPTSQFLADCGGQPQ